MKSELPLEMVEPEIMIFRICLEFSFKKETSVSTTGIVKNLLFEISEIVSQISTMKSSITDRSFVPCSTPQDMFDYEFRSFSDYWKYPNGGSSSV